MHSIRNVHITTPDTAGLLLELAGAFSDLRLDALLFFCSVDYDLELLAAGLVDAFADVPCVVGCTSSGQIGPRGFEQRGLTAVGFSGGDVVITPYVIEPVSISLGACDRIGQAVTQRRHDHSERGAFGLLLVDGLSRAEERLAASLYAALGDIPFVGGSAGDDLAFVETHVYVDGAFRSDRAVFLLVESLVSFATFKFQHYVPTDKQLVVTGADTAQRTIHSLNGLPALEAYAAALGLEPEQVTSTVWSQHPLIVSLGGDTYIRSIQSAEADGSFVLACAIEEGLVLRIGASIDPVATADAAIDAARRRVQGPQLVLGFDCLLRRLEFAETGMLDDISAIYARHGVVGFSTYGEQWDGVHVNQTFTGVVFGS